MNKYIFRYRWWLVLFGGCLLSMVSYAFLIAPQIDQLSALKKTKKEASIALANLSQQKVKPHEKQLISTMTKEEWLALLPMLAQLNSVAIQSMTIKSTKNVAVNELKVRLIVEGEFTTLSRFLLALHERAPNGLVENFLYQLTKQMKLQLTLDLLFIPDLMLQSTRNIQAPYNIINPFCAGAYPAQQNNAIKHYPISQLRLIGRFAQGARQVALIMLPTSAVVDVYVGDEIGVEKAIVNEMNHHQVEMVLPRGDKHVLQMG